MTLATKRANLFDVYGYAQSGDNGTTIDLYITVDPTQAERVNSVNTEKRYIVSLRERKILLTPSPMGNLLMRYGRSKRYRIIFRALPISFADIAERYTDKKWHPGAVAMIKGTVTSLGFAGLGFELCEDTGNVSE